ncbi:MAG: zf-HC2 domain-containing protein [Gemmatimonadota bacterium]
MRPWPWRRRGSRAQTGPVPDAFSCAECLEVLYEFLDGELDSAERPRVKAHLDSCAECFRHLNFEQRFLDQLRSAAAHDDVRSEGLRLRLLELLEREAF